MCDFFSTQNNLRFPVIPETFFWEPNPIVPEVHISIRICGSERDRRKSTFPHCKCIEYPGPLGLRKVCHIINRAYCGSAIWARIFYSLSKINEWYMTVNHQLLLRQQFLVVFIYSSSVLSLVPILYDICSLTLFVAHVELTRISDAVHRRVRIRTKMGFKF